MYIKPEAIVVMGQTTWDLMSDRGAKLMDRDEDWVGLIYRYEYGEGGCLAGHTHHPSSIGVLGGLLEAEGGAVLGGRSERQNVRSARRSAGAYFPGNSTASLRIASLVEGGVVQGPGSIADPIAQLLRPSIAELTAGSWRSIAPRPCRPASI